MGGARDFCLGGPKFKGSRWWRDPHYPDKVTESARLRTQLPTSATGQRWASGPHDLLSTDALVILHCSFIIQSTFSDVCQPSFAKLFRCSVALAVTRNGRLACHTPTPVPLINKGQNKDHYSFRAASFHNAKAHSKSNTMVLISDIVYTVTEVDVGQKTTERDAL